MPAPQQTEPGAFLPFEGGLFEFGSDGSSWSWDNEQPVHKFYVNDFALYNRLITNGEYLEFLEDGGYSRQLLWLDNGYALAQEQGWQQQHHPKTLASHVHIF